MVRLLFERGFRVEEWCDAADVESLAWDAVGVRCGGGEGGNAVEYWRPGASSRVICRCDEVECLQPMLVNSLQTFLRRLTSGSTLPFQSCASVCSSARSLLLFGHGRMLV